MSKQRDVFYTAAGADSMLTTWTDAGQTHTMTGLRVDETANTMLGGGGSNWRVSTL